MNLEEQATLIEHATGHAAQDDNLAVSTFAEAMKHQLLKKRIAGYSGWRECHPDKLCEGLQNAIANGSAIDAANYLAFLWARNETPYFVKVMT